MALNVLPVEFGEHGHFLAPGIPNVGALVGSGVHKGAEIALREKMRDGGLTPLSAMEDAAVAEFHARKEVEAGDGPITIDADAGGLGGAEAQVRRLTGVVFRDIIPNANPIMVESQLAAIFRPKSGPAITLSGRGDLLHLDAGFAYDVRRVRDLKTGRMIGPLGRHDAQVGGYSLLYRSIRVSTDQAQIDFAQRVRHDKPQPALVENVRDLHACERLAHRVLSDFASKADEFLRTGNVSLFVPNPECKLCSPKFCRAFGTKTCSATYQGD